MTCKHHLHVQLLACLAALTIALANLGANAEVNSSVLVDAEEIRQIDSELIHSENENAIEGDRFWAIDTRFISSTARCANLDNPQFSVLQVNRNGRAVKSSLEHYLRAVQGRKVVFYVHGNRMPSGNAIRWGLQIHRFTRGCRRSDSIDWVIWSWPSAKQGLLVHDIRRKADRTDAQGLYLSWVLRRHAEQSIPTALIGFSFGGRVITGALHALAGGSLAGRRLSGDKVTDARFDAGLLAPAIERNWMARRGYHAKATQNIDKLVVMYNQRDAVLKRYWLLDRVRGNIAMGYSGPRSFALRNDGSRIFVRTRDCARYVGKHHDELDYYQTSCRAGSEMAALIDDLEITH